MVQKRGLHIPNGAVRTVEEGELGGNIPVEDSFRYGLSVQYF